MIATPLTAKSAFAVLLVEDDVPLAATICEELRGPAFAVTHASDLAHARSWLSRRAFHLMILDVNLPDGCGFFMAESLRRIGSELPILMLTARASIADRVEGFARGADDYLCKPFAMEELTVRVNALIRRSRAGKKHLLTYRDVQLDLIERTLRRGSVNATLSTREAELLAYFIRHADEKLARERIIQDVWGDAADESSNVLNVYVNYLRNKLESAGGPRVIHTVRGRGYVLSDREPDEF